MKKPILNYFIYTESKDFLYFLGLFFLIQTQYLVYTTSRHFLFLIKTLLSNSKKITHSIVTKTPLITVFLCPFKKNLAYKPYQFAWNLSPSINKKGQVTVEYILLGVALITLLQLSFKILRESDSLKSFQETPQQIFQNMVENGNWEPDETKSRRIHPNHYESQYSSDGKGPR